MSGGLESLSNPLERLSVLPTSSSLRVNPLTNSPVWSAVVQYFKNDIVISGLNGGGYIYTGGAADQTCVRGGVDPAADTAGLWQKLTQTGQESFVGAAPTWALPPAPLPVPPAPCPWTVTGGALAGVEAGSEWMATLQYNITYAAPILATEHTTFTVASDGVAGSTQSQVPVPFVGATTQSGSLSFFVSAGTGPTAPATDITLRLSAVSSAAAAGAYPTAITGRVSWVRLA